MDNNSDLQNQTTGQSQNEKTAYILGVVALCFASLAAAWSFLGGACCGWASWGYSFIGLVLSVVSIVLNRSSLGWWAFGLSIFSIVWVFISASMITGAIGGAGQSLMK